MKINWKRPACSLMMIAITIIGGCTKSETTQPSSNTTTPPASTENYTSMANFFARNGVAAQTYTVTNSVGGSFTSPQGTVVTIPANTFLNSLNQQVTGTVIIIFKDIYQKSDMLLSNIPATTTTGKPLKSAGEFFIQATAGGNAVTLANAITIKQPASQPLDSAMQPFVAQDTLGWALDHLNASLSSTVTNYVYSLYTFSTPAISGTMCNSDDPSYFSNYTQGTLTLQETDNASDYHTYVYLVFTGINTTDACHTYSGNTFSFSSCVPVGLQCTAVAVGVKGGTVYSSFTPITITANQTVTFSMTATTTAAFKAALTALN